MPLAQKPDIMVMLAVLLQSRMRKCKVPAGGDCQDGTLELVGVVKAPLAETWIQSRECYRMQHLGCQDKRDGCDGRLRKPRPSISLCVGELVAKVVSDSRKADRASMG